jgi:hypothetical protein
MSAVRVVITRIQTKRVPIFNFNKNTTRVAVYAKQRLQKPFRLVPVQQPY